MSSKDTHSLITCLNHHIFLLFPESGNCPFQSGSSKSCTKQSTSNHPWWNFSIPSTNLSSHILSLVYFTFIWRVLDFMIPHTQIILLFHPCSYPFWVFFSSSKLTLGMGGCKCQVKEVKCSHTTELNTVRFSISFCIAFDLLCFDCYSEPSWCYGRTI